MVHGSEDGDEEEEDEDTAPQEGNENNASLSMTTTIQNTRRDRNEHASAGHEGESARERDGG